jgi:hypothetical protein
MILIHECNIFFSRPSNYSNNNNNQQSAIGRYVTMADQMKERILLSSVENFAVEAAGGALETFMLHQSFVVNRLVLRGDQPELRGGENVAAAAGAVCMDQ